jgi:hypothetical protein
MPRKQFTFIAAATLAFLIRAKAADTSSSTLPAAPAPAPVVDPVQIVISVPDQRLELVRDGEWLARFPISTSKYGTGDNYGSYRTPIGELKVCDKIGGDLQAGAVIRHRSATGEVLAVNAPGRDPIVTRVIWLDGVEEQNKNARARGIYIHGTPEERTIGTPTSFGCIRMKSKDVIRVFEEVPVGTLVDILPGKLPHMHRYEPPKVQPAAPPEAPASAEEIAANKTSDEKAMIAGASPRDNAPSSAEKKTVAEIAKSMTLNSTEKKSAVAAAGKAVSKPGAGTTQGSPAPLPAIAENTSADHSSSSAWKALRGSFLLANIPSVESDKDEHRKKDTQ